MDKNNHFYKHGMSRSRVYRCWANMIQRCTYKKHIGYKHYGGRGIGVCKKWLKFENFYEDMGDIPTDKSLDRIDNDKGYSKSNCRWACRSLQASNKKKKIKGVQLIGGKNPWRAQIRLNNKIKHIGNFNKIADAYKAYRKEYDKKIKDLLES